VKVHSSSTAGTSDPALGLDRRPARFRHLRCTFHGPGVAMRSTHRVAPPDHPRPASGWSIPSSPTTAPLSPWRRRGGRS